MLYLQYCFSQCGRIVFRGPFITLLYFKKAYLFKRFDILNIYHLHITYVNQFPLIFQQGQQGLVSLGASLKQEHGLTEEAAVSSYTTESETHPTDRTSPVSAEDSVSLGTRSRLTLEKLNKIGCVKKTECLYVHE